jgi:hypothetical protein
MLGYPDAQQPTRVWVSQVDSDQSVVLIDVVDSSDGVPSSTYKMAVAAWIAEWFQGRCETLLEDVPPRDSVHICPGIRDGNWISVAQSHSSSWREGDTYDLHSNADINELYEATRALIAAATAPPELVKLHLQKVWEIAKPWQVRNAANDP